MSENSPANLGAKNVLFRKAPIDLEVEAETRVLGRKFREVGATTGVCQVRSTIGDTLTWTRECIVSGRSGYAFPDDGTPWRLASSSRTCVSSERSSCSSD